MRNWLVGTLTRPEYDEVSDQRGERAAFLREAPHLFAVVEADDEFEAVEKAVGTLGRPGEYFAVEVAAVTVALKAA